MRVENDVLAVLSAATMRGNGLTLNGQLDRKLYERTNKVLEAAGGKWKRGAKEHQFPGDASDAIEQIILSGEVTVPQDFGYFPTPPAVVARLVELAEAPYGCELLEPSAGTGNIAEAFRGHCRVTCIELLPKNVQALNALGWINCVIEADFLSLTPAPTADRVVMNPPFAKQADIHHVMHALKCLRPGGRLVSVMSAGMLFRENRLTSEFRALVASRGSIESVPDGAFKESGTMVRTVIVTLEN